MQRLFESFVNFQPFGSNMLTEPDGEFLRHIPADVLVILIEATVAGQNPYSDLFLHLLIVSQVHDLREKSKNHAIKKS